MKIRHNDLIIPTENPFQNCRLGREKYADVLTTIIGQYADGFVLSINNEWGTGKTTFVKMWQQKLVNAGYQTIYFNAWENDFDQNPLVALVSELKSLKNEKNTKVFNEIVSKGAILVKNIAPAVIKALVKKHLGDVGEELADIAEKSTKGVTEILQNEIEEYTLKKVTITDFRNKLELFIENSEKEKPVVIILDELDRCRPTYAVELLEQIKHFFSVKGIVFVLSIDKVHLSASIMGFYGSDKIDSNEYLRRFIDLEYSIPQPSTRNFINYLSEYYTFDDFFFSPERSKIDELKREKELLLLFAEYLFTTTNSTLRQKERIFALLRIILTSFNPNQYTFSPLLFLLIFLKVMRPELYKQIEKNTISLQELSDTFYNLINSEQIALAEINFIYMEAMLLWFYNNCREHRTQIELLQKIENGKYKTPIVSKLTKKEGDLEYSFLRLIDNNLENTKLTYLLEKINLSSSLKI